MVSRRKPHYRSEAWLTLRAQPFKRASGALGVSAITYSTNRCIPSPAGAFLLAYQAADGIHIAEAQVARKPSGTGHYERRLHYAGTVVHDIIDIVGQTLTPAFASHVAFVV